MKGLFPSFVKAIQRFISLSLFLSFSPSLVNQLQFISHLKLCIFIGRKKKKKNHSKHKSCTFQSHYHFSLIVFNICFRCTRQRITGTVPLGCRPVYIYIPLGCNRVHIYIYIYIYICTRLVYTTDTVPLGYESVCHNSTFVRLLLVYQFILNSNSNG